MDSCNDTPKGGLPHSDIHGSKPARGSPWLFAACHVLHRLLVPRHPPNALIILRSSGQNQSSASQSPVVRNSSRPIGDVAIFPPSAGTTIASQRGVSPVGFPARSPPISILSRQNPHFPPFPQEHRHPPHPSPNPPP